MDEVNRENYPSAYLITIRSYGTWLHGDDNGSVDRHGFNIYGTPRMFHSEKLKNLMKAQMNQEPTVFDKSERICVLKSVKEVCDYRGYDLLAVNIRTNHLHAVVSANMNPDKIANDFKAYATRRLREAKLVELGKIIWSRGKSGRYLWKPKHVELAVEYVLFGQGDEIPAFD